MTDCEVRPVVLDDRWRVHGLAVFGREKVNVLLANLARQPRTIELPKGLRRSGTWRMRILNEDNLAEAMTSPERFRQTQATALTEDMLTLPGQALIHVRNSAACFALVFSTPTVFPCSTTSLSEGAGAIRADGHGHSHLGHGPVSVR